MPRKTGQICLYFVVIFMTMTLQSQQEFPLRNFSHLGIGRTLNLELFCLLCFLFLSHLTRCAPRNTRISSHIARKIHARAGALFHAQKGLELDFRPYTRCEDAPRKSAIVHRNEPRCEDAPCKRSTPSQDAKCPTWWYEHNLRLRVSCDANL